jgi:catechol 2,3-dioxygenase-like lactoylglutathione lyase family enzyme
VTADLFAGIPVTDLALASAWYEGVLGAAPAFRPNDDEAVWQVAEHGHVYVVRKPGHAGHATHTLFVDDLEARLAAAARHGLEPARIEAYDNGVRKAVFIDPDGNEFCFGGM